MKALQNLAKTGSLKAEQPDQSEFDGLLKTARAKMADARLPGLSRDGKFDLAYAAAHAFSLAALRWYGFRSENRFLVFQCTPHTLGLDEALWRTLADCHQKRNIAEYEGHLDISDALLTELVRIVSVLSDRVSKLGPVKKNANS